MNYKIEYQTNKETVYINEIAYAPVKKIIDDIPDDLGFEDIRIEKIKSELRNKWL